MISQNSRYNFKICMFCLDLQSKKTKYNQFTMTQSKTAALGDDINANFWYLCLKNQLDDLMISNISADQIFWRSTNQFSD